MTIHRRQQSSLIAGASLLVIGLLGTACSDRNGNSAPLAAPNSQAVSDAVSADRSPNIDPSRPNISVRWNEVARSLVAARNTNAPLASRVYALVSVAQFGAVAAVHGTDQGGTDRGGNADRHRNPNDANLDAAIARASADVLKGVFPDGASAAVIDAALDADAVLSRVQSRVGGGAAGDAIGARVASAVLARAATDGSANANCPATPPTPASRFWHDDAVPPNPQPVLPCFGSVRPWLPINVKVFRTPRPPAFGSPVFLAGLAEVRHISDTRTADQLAIVNKWADGTNTFSTPGRWNLIASDMVTRHHLDAARAARLFAVLNVAMMDTHIACWDRKYTYWEIRPWMVDSLITTPIGKPHHPASPSGHACAGGAGSGVLAGFFPAERASLLAMGDEQGFSTVLAGVHYRFDVDTGLRIGRSIAVVALAENAIEKLLERVDRR
jgi:membrane-associated phospholipid phosphatase